MDETQTETVLRYIPDEDFPPIYIDDSEADPEFVEIGKQAILNFEYSQLSELDQNAFRIMKDCGYENTLNGIREAMQECRDKGINNPSSFAADVSWNAPRKLIQVL